MPQGGCNSPESCSTMVAWDEDETVCVCMAIIYYVTGFYVSACMCKCALTSVLLSNSVVVRLVLRLWIKTWPSWVHSDTSCSVKQKQNKKSAFNSWASDWPEHRPVLGQLLKMNVLFVVLLLQELLLIRKLQAVICFTICYFSFMLQLTKLIIDIYINTNLT